MSFDLPPRRLHVADHELWSRNVGIAIRGLADAFPRRQVIFDRFNGKMLGGFQLPWAHNDNGDRPPPVAS